MSDRVETLESLREEIASLKKENIIIATDLGTMIAVNTNLRTRLQEMEGALKAADRLLFGKYRHWSDSGGYDECAHGVAAIFDCDKCDKAKFLAALSRKEQAEGEEKV